MANEDDASLFATLLPSRSNCGDEEGMGVDEMLERYVGEFGPWQRRQFVLTSLAWALNAIHTMVVVFADREPAWRCTGTLMGECPSSVCGLRPGEWEWVGGDGSSSSTTVVEWELVCGRKYMVGLVQSAFFAGSIVGAGVFGHLSDSRLGRKGALTISCAMNAAFGLLTALSPAVPFYAALRFLTGVGTGGVGLSAFVLGTEPVGPSKRGVVGMSSFYPFAVGTILLSAAAASIHSWRTLYVVSSLPSLLFLTTLLPFISESPRWCIVHNKTMQAMDVMRSIATKNGRHLPDNATLIVDGNNEHRSGDDRSTTILDVVRSPVACTRLVLTVIINLFSAFSYYGLNLNAGNIGGNVYITVILNAAVEIPAYALTAASLKRCGRRPLTVGAMSLSGAFCVAGGVLADAPWMRMVCGVVGIFLVTAAFNLLYVHATELFPTVVRNAALGIVSQAAQVGAVAAPPVVVLGGRWPFVAFGACGVAGGMLALLLPETLDRPLYDTMAGMERDEMEKGIEA